MHTDLIFDDEGNVWNSHSADLKRLIGWPDTVNPPLEYLVKNLGFVHLISNPGRAVIAMRPSVMADATAAGLMYYISDWPYDALGLRLYDDKIRSWRYELLGAHDRAIGRIAAILHDVQSIRQKSSYLSRQVLFSTIDQNSPLQLGIEYFKDCNGELTSDHIAELPNVLAARHMLYKFDESSHQLILHSVAGSFPKPIQSYLFNAIGSDIRDRPDMAYGQECANAYLSSALADTPMCFEVDAISKWSASGERLRRRYRRAIFPLHDRDGAKWLLGQSLPDDTVDLRATAC